MNKKVLIVDDHPIVRQGLRQIIENEKKIFEKCWEAADEQEAMIALEKNRPDVAIVDISLSGSSGLELIKQFIAIKPKLPILVLSMHDEQHFAERALRCGAHGYIMKQEAPDKVVEALQTILKGDIYLSEKMKNIILTKITGGAKNNQQAAHGCLSDRELEILQMIGKGFSSRKISEQLHVSIKTIESHRENIKKKLKIKTANALHQYAFQWMQNQTG